MILFCLYISMSHAHCTYVSSLTCYKPSFFLNLNISEFISLKRDEYCLGNLKKYYKFLENWLGWKIIYRNTVMSKELDQTVLKKLHFKIKPVWVWSFTYKHIYIFSSPGTSKQGQRIMLNSAIQRQRIPLNSAIQRLCHRYLLWYLIP